MSERMIRNEDITIATQSFGDPEKPSILLVMGAMASMLWWPEDFCRDLAAKGFHVIRYDNRDTGLSTTFPPGEPTYTIDDMAGDAFAVLDGYGLSAAHVVGMSLGGMIAQRIALSHPERVLSLTLISTSPLGIDGLPDMTAEYAAHAASGEAVDWSDTQSILDFMLRDVAMIASRKHPHDAAAARRFLTTDIGRARSFASATNHFILPEGETPPEAAASRITSRLLVIHGSEDPLFALPHGEALAEAVPGARLVVIDGGGHEIHPADAPRIVAEIAAHAGQDA